MKQKWCQLWEDKTTGILSSDALSSNTAGRGFHSPFTHTTIPIPHPLICAYSAYYRLYFQLRLGCLCVTEVMRTCQRTFPGLCYRPHFKGLNWPCSSRVTQLLCRVWPSVNYCILIRFPGSQGWTSVLRLLQLTTLSTHQSHRDWRRKYKISLESYHLSYSYSISKGRKITVQDLAQFLFASEVLVGYIRNY